MSKKREIPGDYSVEITTVDEHTTSYHDHVYLVDDADGAMDAMKKAQKNLRPSERVVSIRAILLVGGLILLALLLSGAIK